MAAPKKQETAVSNVAEYGWAVNVVKLNRAKAHVNLTTPGLKGKDLEAAVRTRYEELGGLTKDDVTVRQPKAGAKEQNMAEDDGSPD